MINSTVADFMETKVELRERSGSYHVLLVGNNPIDMSKVLEKLNQIRGVKIITEIAFDVKSILDRLIQFKPNFILIDDNIGKNELTETVNTLTSSNKTKDVPITVLKNSNYEEAYGSSVVLDYLLKTNLSSDSLYRTLKNSFRLKKTQAYLMKVYQKRSKQLRKFYS